MKTGDLVRMLAADQGGRPHSLRRLLLVGIGIGLMAGGLLFAWGLGLRPDIAAVSGDLRFLLKFVVTLALAVSAGGLLLRLLRPGASRGLWLPALVVGPVALGLGVTYELIVIDPAAWAPRLWGRNWARCLISIPLLAAPALAAVLITLRPGAPTHPVLAGAVAGILAGALGGALYAAHCPDDSPLFVLAWYGISIAFVGLIGALAGGRLLRW